MEKNGRRVEARGGMELEQQRYHSRQDEGGRTELEGMRCEQVRKGVQYVQENQDWQEKEGKQSLCITSFYV